MIQGTRPQGRTRQLIGALGRMLVARCWIGVVLAAVPCFALPAPAQCETQHLLGSDAPDSRAVGTNLSMDGAVFVAGAPLGKSWSGETSGAVFLFERASGLWAETSKLLASDAAAGDRFGEAVAVEGSKVIVGAPLKLWALPQSIYGAAYVFQEAGGSWGETQKLPPPVPQSGALFGFAVAVEGSWVLVGAPYHDAAASDSGLVFVFEFDGASWVERQILMSSDASAGDRFGNSINIDGGRVAVGAVADSHVSPLAGSVYVFELSGGSWSETAKLVAADSEQGGQFGASVWQQGDRLVVGSPGKDVVEDAAGAVYVFEQVGGAWTQAAKLTASDPGWNEQFGASVSMDEDRLLIGAPEDFDSGKGLGAAYLFQYAGGGWTQTAKLRGSHVADSNLFGHAVALEGSVGIIGDPDDFVAGPDVGAVYVYDLPQDVTPYCFGLSCPCGNEDTFRGCANSTGRGALLSACGTASVTADDLVLTATELPARQSGILYMGPAQIEAPFGDGLRCVGAGGVGIFRYLPVAGSGPEGTLVYGPGLVARADAEFPPAGHLDSGESWSFQAWYRDPAGPCGHFFNLSNAVEVTFTP